jgi:hypothetical protein
VLGFTPTLGQSRVATTSAWRRDKKYTLMAYDPHQFDLIFVSYFLHPFISLTLASSPIRKHVRYALSKLFIIGNKVVQKQLKNKEKSILCLASSLFNEPLELYYQNNCKG